MTLEHKITRQAIRRLPKAELHLHLDGSMRVRTVMELARQRGIELPDTNLPDLEDDLEVHGQVKDLAEYLEKFCIPLEVLQDHAALERVACELVAVLKGENMLYTEVRFAPMLHTKKGLRLEEIVEAVLEGLRRGESDHGVKTGLIACCMRHMSPDDNLKMAQVAVKYRDWGLVGLDLAGDEASFDRSIIPWDAFKLARDKDLGITVHAGEASGAGSIQAALEMGAQRLGHGVRLEEDRALLEEVRKKGIALEMCPTSNVQTRAVESLSVHPIDRYLRAQLMVTVSTDNRRVSDTTMTHEYCQLAQEFGWGLPQIRETTENALRASFLPQSEKAALLAEFESRWSAAAAKVNED
jgi:adenosine deaminase